MKHGSATSQYRRRAARCLATLVALDTALRLVGPILPTSLTYLAFAFCSAFALGVLLAAFLLMVRSLLVLGFALGRYLCTTSDAVYWGNICSPHRCFATFLLQGFVSALDLLDQQRRQWQGLRMSHGEGASHRPGSRCVAGIWHLAAPLRNLRIQIAIRVLSWGECLEQTSMRVGMTPPMQQGILENLGYAHTALSTVSEACLRRAAYLTFLCALLLFGNWGDAVSFLRLCLERASLEKQLFATLSAPLTYHLFSSWAQGAMASLPASIVTEACAYYLGLCVKDAWDMYLDVQSHVPGCRSATIAAVTAIMCLRGVSSPLLFLMLLALWLMPAKHLWWSSGADEGDVSDGGRLVSYLNAFIVFFVPYVTMKCQMRHAQRYKHDYT